MMRQAISGRGQRSSLLIAVLACFSLTRVVAQTRGTVFFKKFQLFFELLDQSGGLSQEFTASDGDLCSVTGISCQDGDVTAMYDHQLHMLPNSQVSGFVVLPRPFLALDLLVFQLNVACPECASNLADLRSVFCSARLEATYFGC